MLFKFLQLAKISSPNEVIPLGKETLVKLLQAQKQPFPNEVRPEGKLMFDKLLQYKKQHCPSEVKPEGNLTLFKLPQLLYLQPIITQYFIDNKSEIWLLFLIAHSKR